jgi:hypothetical protein
VIDVVEKETRDGVDTQCVATRWRRELAHLVVVGVKGERDKCLESPRLVLQVAHTLHMVDTLLHGLDVAIEHRHVRPHPEAVRGAMDGEKAVGPTLVVADLSPDSRGKNLRAATRQRVEAGVHQLADHLLI